jgi:hypothetical protein
VVATTSLILLFALVVAIKIAGAAWETLAWRAIYRAALTCGQETFRPATPGLLTVAVG